MDLIRQDPNIMYIDYTIDQLLGLLAYYKAKYPKRAK